MRTPAALKVDAARMSRHRKVRARKYVTMHCVFLVASRSPNRSRES